MNSTVCLAQEGASSAPSETKPSPQGSDQGEVAEATAKPDDPAPGKAESSSPPSPAASSEPSKPAAEPVASSGADEGGGHGWKKITGWAMVAVGGAAIVTGVVLSPLAADKADEYDEAKAANRTYYELEQIATKGRNLETGQVTALTLGVAVVAVGVHLLLWNAMSDDEQGEGDATITAAVAPVITGQGVGLAGVARF